MHHLRIRGLLIILPICLIGIVIYLQNLKNQNIAQLELELLNRDFASAKSGIDALLDSNPNSPIAHYLLARYELASDKPERAIKEIDTASNLGYSSSAVNVLRGLVLARGGKYDEAEQLLLPALATLQKPPPEVAEGLALIYLSRFDLKKASQMIEFWKSLAPLDDRPYLFRNEIDHRTGAERAVILQNYQNALLRNPENQKARLEVAKLYFDDQNFDQAKKKFTEYLEREPENLEAMIGLGQIASANGDSGTAESMFTEVLRTNSKNVTALTEIAEIEVQKGLLEQAADHLKKASEESPFDWSILYKYSQTLKLLGKPELAKKLSDKSLKLKSDQAKVEELRKAIVQKPDDINLRVEAAQWLINHGHEKEGLEWAELILKGNPRHIGMCQFLKEYYHKKQNFGLSNYYETLLTGQIRNQ